MRRSAPPKVQLPAISGVWIKPSCSPSGVKTYTPAVSPSPRGGHALLWLPRAKKLLLLEGGDHRSAQHDAELQGESLRWLARAMT